MKDHDDPMLVAVAEAVTDGVTVDWVGLKANHPALVGDLGDMEAMAEVAEAYRALRESGA